MSHVVGKPATPGGDVGGDEPHSHPLPPSVRLALVAYGLLFPLVLGALGFLLLQQAHEDDRNRARAKAANERQVEQVRAELAAAAQELAQTIERRKAARDAETARDREQLRQAVCAFLTEDRPDTTATKRLAVQFRCGLPPIQEASPAPGPTVQAPSPMAQERDDEQPIARPEPSPAPSPEPPPPPPASPPPRPTPSPSPTCLSLPIVGCL